MTFLSELPYPPALTPQMIEDVAAFICADPDLSAAFDRMIRCFDSFLVPADARRYRCGSGWVVWHDGRWQPIARAGKTWVWA